MTFGVNVLIVALLAALATVFGGGSAQADTPGDTPFITWNMQGATTTGQSVWSTYVPQLLNNNAANVLMLQEAGAAPPSGATPLNNPTGDGRVSVYSWNRMTQSRPETWYVYFLQSNNPQVPGGRVNTIVMSRTQADDVLVVDNPLSVTPGRPAIGIRLGNDYYFSFHALSGGGGDAVGMLDAIGRAVRHRGAGYNWTVGADFNTEPNSLTGRPDYTTLPTPSGHPPAIVATGQPTQRSGRELDYAVTTASSSSLQANLLPNQGGSDHDPVQVLAQQTRADPSTHPNYEFRPMTAGGYAINGSNPAASSLGYAGMRRPLRSSMVQYMGSCKQWHPTTLAAADGSVSFDYVGAVTAGDVAPGEDEEEAFPGQSVDQLRQHLATDLRTYKPDVVLLQIDVANDLDTQSGLTTGQESSELKNLLNQVYYTLPNTTVLLGDPAPSARSAVRNEIYSGSNSYVSQSDQVIADEQRAGHRIQQVSFDFEHDPSYLDTSQSVDGVPNYDAYENMATNYAKALFALEQSGTIVDPSAVVANPANIIEDGSGIDDTGEAGGSGATQPCDIYSAGGTPCAEAVSMVRAMYSSYDGPLYQVQRASDQTSKDIGVVAKGGAADAAAQDSFCANTSCVITKIYDQSPMHNDLTVEGAGSAAGADHAAALPVTIGGKKAYGLDVSGQVGYRNNATHGIAKQGAAEGMYMVASGTHVNSGCCFDFGNAETNTTDNGNGHMDAVNVSTTCFFAPCNGSGPWVEADMENGLFQGANGSNLANKGNGSNFVTTLLKNNGQTNYAIKGGNAQSGGLSTAWNGNLPDRGGYIPIQQEGAVVLGTGGDNSNTSIGSFFEGVMTQGYPGDSAVQSNIVSAGYGGNSGGTGDTTTNPPTAGQSVVHDGYPSVDSVNGHLQESYLSAMNAPWKTQDLSANYHTPRVMQGTQPVAVYHGGYTSVYTIDDGSGDLQETYLSAIGKSWVTQDLTKNYGAPPSFRTPTAVVHGGYTSVYTIDANYHLQETYLANVGAPWASQDFTAKYHTPQVLPGTSPVALYHGGYTSVYTIDAGSHHLQESYLQTIGQDWKTQDLSANYGAPPSSTTPGGVVHAGYTSVYTVDDGSGDLQETYLANVGAPWASQDFTAKYHTPRVASGTHPVALYHTGYTSVYTVDGANNHLQETYLAKIGATWATQDFNAGYHTPPTTTTPIALLHPAVGGALTFSSVYTFNQFNNHLQESYLPAIGDQWTTQDLSYGYHTPPAMVTPIPTDQWSTVHSGYTSVYTVDKGRGLSGSLWVGLVIMEGWGFALARKDHVE